MVMFTRDFEVSVNFNVESQRENVHNLLCFLHDLLMSFLSLFKGHLVQPFCICLLMTFYELIHIPIRTQFNFTYEIGLVQE